MKKIFNLALMMIMCLFLVTGCGEKVDTSKYRENYKTMNLDEILTQEKIEHDFSSYKETDDQITIYMFRGNGCSFCKGFLNYLNSIVPEYGKYFKVVSYEVWGDQANSELMGEVSTFFGQKATGVPYIIIGDQVFGGYSNRYDEAIKAAIKNLYDSKDRYDVFEAMEQAKIDAKREEQIQKIMDIIPSIVVCFIGVITVLVISTNQKKVLLSKINALEEELNQIRNQSKENNVVDTQKENKKTTKKVTKKTNSKTK